uniref:Uncharacterized protein n=1 Tax=Arundo donax TaxID=35708 RepID=A0A0A9G6G7_ARUDO
MPFLLKAVPPGLPSRRAALVVVARRT